MTVPRPCAHAVCTCSCASLLPCAVRPLLQSPDSPLSELYSECEVCETLDARNRAAQMAVSQAGVRVGVHGPHGWSHGAGAGAQCMVDTRVGRGNGGDWSPLAGQ
jgi:hypothetical protein